MTISQYLGDMETGGPEGQSHFLVLSEFKASLAM